MTQCPKCHTVFAEGDKCPVCGTKVQKGWLPSLGGGGIGNVFKTLTIVTILLFIGFFILTEIAMFNFKNFFINCSGYNISGFGINFLTFVVGVIITLMIMKQGLLARTIIVALLFFSSFLMSGLVYPYCSTGLKFIGGIGSSFICSIKNLGDSQKCLASTNTTAPPPTKVIYQFQPIEIKFGSKYTPTPFTPPTLYANDPYGYNLIITVTNPNTENELTVDGFYIRSYFAESGENNNSDMFGSNSRKIMCGKADMCNETNPCSLAPGSDTEISLSFNDNANCTSAYDLTTTISEDDCKDENLNNTDDCILAPNPKDPTAILGCSKQSESCLKELCKEKCADEYPCVNFAGFGNKTSRQCLCIRNVNNVTDLCCEDAFGSEVNIRFYAAHNFSVLGIGEFRIAENEQYLNFEPVVFSSAGPLVATVYFEPHAILSNKTRDILMYVNLKNDGYGKININDINIEQMKDKIGFIDDNIITCIKDTTDRITLLNSGEIRESVCRLGLGQGTVETYSTIRMNVEINYTYTWLNSKTLPIVKTYFDPTKPEQQSFIGMAGYCPMA